MSFQSQSPSIEARIARPLGQRNIVLELPTELLQECFRLLELRGRIAVSHVSRGWRAVALNDRTLWNAATAPHTGRRCGPEMLRSLLARSDPLPFSFSWNRTYVLPDMSADVVGLVCSNMHRMRVISASGLLYNQTARLVRQPAPLLEQFDSRDADSPANLTSLWPMIKVLRIGSLSVFPPVTQRFETVTLFSCLGVESFTRAGISLFGVFPALKSLSVRHILQEDVACLSDPPDCLDELLINVIYAIKIDYTPVLRACRRLSLKALHLECSRDAAAVMQPFSEAVQAPWRMYVAGRDEVCVELRDDAQDRTWSFTCSQSIRIPFLEPRIAECLSLLGHLTASPTLLVQFHNLVGWSRSLPALRSLTLKLAVSMYTDDVPSPCPAPPVRMPQLESLTLWLDDDASYGIQELDELDDDVSDRIQELLERRLPALLPALIEHALPVVLNIYNSEYLLTCNLEPLSAITEELRVQERSSGKTTVYVAPGGFTA